MNLFLTLILFCVSILGEAQSFTIKGRTLDKTGAPIASTTITLHKKNSKAILAFTFSNNDGYFELKFNETSSDILELKAALLSYGSQSFFFLPGNKTDFQFSLLLQSITLSEVKVTNKPVWQKKDTINYRVSEFKQQQDRVIGDIIARLPGIEVTPGGQIKYQGKPINKYYIEGLDLLEDRYGIANNNIPAESVDKVQILENHQPIRVLDSISFSERAALNIKLKSNAKMKLLGRAKLGIGASPLLSEDELTGMLFKKKLQFINTYKYNNTGLDNTKELTARNINDYINAIQNGAIKSDLVSLVKAGPPLVNPKRYLFNNAHVVSVNQLLPLNSLYQLRINASFVNDYQKQQSSVLTKIYLPSDTISIGEYNNFHISQNMLQTDFAVMANTPKFYFKNLLKFQGNWSAEAGRVIITSEIIQKLSNPFYNISNDFRLLKTKKKYVQEWASYVGYVSLPQSLTIRPGLYEDLLNSNIPYNSLLQKASLKTFYTNNYLSLKKRKSRFSSQYKLGFNIQSKFFYTDLLINKLGVEQPVTGLFQNRLNWQHYRIYDENNWSYETDRIILNLSLPATYTKIIYNDTFSQTKSGKESLFVNPAISFTYQLSPKWNFNASAAYNKDFGDISGITSGYILQNYRSFSNNDAPLAEIELFNISSSLTFHNPLKIIFFNTGINFSKNRSNLMYKQAFNGSLETIQGVLLANFQNSTSFFGRFSKYIIDWKTTIGFNYSYSFGNQQQLQQSKLVKFANRNYSAGANLGVKFSSKLTMDYNGTYFTYLSKSQLQQSATSIQSASQNFSFNYFPTDKLIFRVSAEHYYINNRLAPSNNYYFADMNFRYKPKKSKIDYELAFQNLFNTKSFTTAALSNNIEMVSEYQIRPLQLLFKMSFSF